MDASMIEELYKSKNRDYYNQVRFDMIDVLKEYLQPNQESIFLDVGCGSCDTLVYLKENGIAKIADGIELSIIKGSNQESVLIDNLYIGQIEDNIYKLEDTYYDFILCLDVLEHLIDPWTIVSLLSEKLKSGGYLIVSCPNIREIKNIYNIFFKGSFKYTDSGILDRTHLRHFCPSDMETLCTTEKLKVINSIPNYKMAPNRGKLKMIHFGLLNPIFAPQYFVISKKI
jgi:2-polyprenyl-3-methyl-5-hydroxy-6-metoxy-1,4-benzoquinol methylase